MLRRLTYENSRGEKIVFYLSPFLIERLEGIGEVDADVQGQQSPYQDGDTYIDTVLEPRFIELEGSIAARDRIQIRKYRREISRVCNPKLGLGLITLELDGDIKQIRGTLDGGVMFPERERDPWQPFMITWKCPNPYWQSPTITEEPAFEPLFEFPFEGEYEDGLMNVAGVDYEYPLTLKGKRNLLVGTSDEFESTSFSTWNSKIYNEINIALPGETYSARVYLKPYDRPVTIRMFSDDGSGAWANQMESNNGNIIQPGEEGYATITFKTPNNATKIRLAIRNTSTGAPTNKVEYKEAVLVRGELPEVWKVAPEDLGLEYPSAITDFLPTAKFEMGMQRDERIINNNGDAPAPLQVEFFGPALNPKIINNTTGEYIKVNQELKENERMLIDTTDGNKSVFFVDENGSERDVFNWIDLGSTFFKLEVGDNDIEYTADSNIQGAIVNITYNELFVGV